jgi:hypothetical protein
MFITLLLYRLFKFFIARARKAWLGLGVGVQKKIRYFVGKEALISL